MTDAQKLEKIISRAVENGWEWYTNTDSEVIVGHFKNMDGKLVRSMYNDIIFDHDFCKAVYGTKPTCYICGGTEVKSGETHTDTIHEHYANCAGCGAEWINKLEFEDEGNYLPAHLYHIQKMAFADDRIDYCYRNRRDV